MSRAVLLLLMALPAGAQPVYDLLIKNGHVIDPASGRDGRTDVAVTGGTIVRVARDLSGSQAKKVVDATGYYVMPGLIDIHTHLDTFGPPLSLNADHQNLRNCVCTAVDAGTTGWKTFERFKKQVADPSRVRVLALLNIVGSGMYGPKVEDNVEDMDPEATAKMVKKHPDILVGIKTAHFSLLTWDAIDRATKAAELSNTILMVDFWPKPGREFRDILKRMRPGDLYTHTYGSPVILLDENKRVHHYVWEARRRGVLFDVGHGAGSFWFRIAAPATGQGFWPDTISTDIHKNSIMLPQATMPMTMSKFLNLGMPLNQAVEKSTIAPARSLHLNGLGTLREGAVADIAVMKLDRGTFAYLDSGRGKLTGNQRLRCALTVRAGKVVWDNDGLFAEEWKNAGPYSNFK
ncbi:MAG: amidohydrolase/deacetylase family metallohydrolase [Bryobacteraceae bacterium]